MARPRLRDQLPFRPRFMLALVILFCGGLAGSILKLESVAYACIAISVPIAFAEIHSFLTMKNLKYGKNEDGSDGEGTG